MSAVSWCAVETYVAVAESSAAAASHVAQREISRESRLRPQTDSYRHVDVSSAASRSGRVVEPAHHISLRLHATLAAVAAAAAAVHYSYYSLLASSSSR